MFILEGKLTFINIEQSYLKKLHDACSEVYYKPSGYENKPYIGILINKNDRKYVIPLSSAKEKHKTWKNVKKYKDLLNKEYSFCLKVIDEVIGRANKLYDKQMATGRWLSSVVILRH